MNHDANNLDESFDAALRDAGPRLEEPRAPDEVRRRVAAMLEGGSLPVAAGADGRANANDAPMRTIRRLQFTVGGLAACVIALLTVAVLTHLEVRRLGELIVLERDGTVFTTDLLRANLAVVNFDHDMCPLAAEMTPRYRQLVQRHPAAPVEFINLDLSENAWMNTLQRTKERGLTCVFGGLPPGSETGVVKLVDVDRCEVIMSADNELFLSRIEMILKRLEAMEAPPAASPGPAEVIPGA